MIGTEKQVKWAKDIRERALERQKEKLNIFKLIAGGTIFYKPIFAISREDEIAKTWIEKNFMKNKKRAERVISQIKESIEVIKAIDSAAWWIENRHDINKSLFEKDELKDLLMLRVANDIHVEITEDGWLLEKTENLKLKDYMNLRWDKLFS